MSTDTPTVAPKFTRGMRVAIVSIVSDRAQRIETIEAVNKTGLRVSAPQDTYSRPWTLDGAEGYQKYGSGPIVPSKTPTLRIRAVRLGDELDAEAYAIASRLSSMRWEAWHALPIAALRAITVEIAKGVES